MKLRTLKPAALVDVNGVAGLDGDRGERRTGCGSARSRGSRRCSRASPRASRSRSSMPPAATSGYLATRHRGTVGGSLAYAAPWAELTAAAVALDATIEVRSARGDRAVIARASSSVGPHETVLEPDELLTAVASRRPAPRTGVGFHEVSAALPRLRAGRGSGRGRHGRRRRSVQRCRARAPPRRARAASGRRLRPPRHAARGRGARRARREPRRPRPARRHRGVGHATGGASPRRSRAGRCATPSTTPRERRERRSSPVRVEVNGRLARGLGRAARYARRLPSRRPRPDRHARRLRARLLRQLQRARSTARRSARASCSPCRPTAAR